MTEAVLDALYANATLWRARGRPGSGDGEGARLSTGWPKLDAQLAGGGWPLGTLIELLLPDSGVGELSLLLPALGELVREAPGEERPWLVWVAPPHAPYPPALAQSGVPPERVLLVTADRTPDRLWAIEQALRSASCAAVFGWLDAVDDRWLRRLKLAAETGQALAVIFRPLGRRAASSPASLRVALEPTPKGLDLWLLKRRGRGPVRVHDVLRS